MVYTMAWTGHNGDYVLFGYKVPAIQKDQLTLLIEVLEPWL
jgi:hypothetical protein